MLTDPYRCIRCSVYFDPDVAGRELAMDSDGRFVCVNVGACHRRVEWRLRFLRAVGRRHVPGLGWVGRR